MLDVFFTVDVEIWCDGWIDIGERFAASFRKYVYGPTPQGDYGLPYTLRVLADHGLAGVFFVEPLFATRFGIDPFAEIVGLIKEAGQEIQLHMHTEWVDESIEPLLAGIDSKRQFLRSFSREEQTLLIAAGKDLLAKAGGPNARAFRAGSFGFNYDTLGALADNQIIFDSSYNASMSGLTSGVLPGVVITDAATCDGVYEYPLTVFNDATGSLRHAQLTACSYRELEGLLWQALENERKCFVILSHNFELLNESKSRPDGIVVQRYRKLCSFLDKNRDSFRVRGFESLLAQAVSSQPAPLTSPLWKTAERVLQQARRRVYG
jgi:peptidoglycan/xylan/chitin deacetylase (PgdA/CDA1 family)